MVTTFERYVNQDKKSYLPESKSSSSQSKVDKDIDRYVKSGVYSKSYAENLQKQRDAKKTTSTVKKTSSSSNTSSQSKPKQFSFIPDKKEQPMSMAPTQEEFKEAERRNTTVSKIRRPSSSGSTISSSLQSKLKQFSFIPDKKEQPMSMAPTQEEFNKVDSVQSEIKRPGVSSLNNGVRTNQSVDRGSLLNLIDSDSVGQETKTKIRYEKEIVVPKNKIDIDFSGVEEKPTVPKIKSDIERLKQREESLSNLQEELKVKIDNLNTRRGYQETKLTEKEQEIKDKKIRLEELEKEYSSRPITKQEQEQFKNLYSEYQTDIEDYNKRIERLTELNVDGSQLKTKTEQFNKEVKTFEEQQAELNKKIENLNKALIIDSPTEKDFNEMGVKKFDDVSIDMTSAQQEVTKKLKDLSEQQTPTFGSFDASSVPGFKPEKTIKEKRDSKIKEMEKELALDTSKYFGRSIKDEFQEKKLDGFGGNVITGLEVAGARAQNFAKVTSEALRLKSAKKDNDLAQTLYALPAALTEDTGGLLSSLRVGYAFSEKGLEQDISTKRAKIDAPYEQLAVLGAVAGVAGAVDNIASGVAKKRALKFSQVEDLNKVFDDLNIDKVSKKEGLNLLKDDKSLLFNKFSERKPSPRKAFNQLQESTSKGLASSNVDFLPTGLVGGETTSKTAIRQFDELNKLFDDVNIGKIKKTEIGILKTTEEFDMLKDTTRTRRLSILQDSDKIKGIVDSPVFDTATTQKFKDAVTTFSRGDERGIVIGDTVYGTLDLGKGAKISYKSFDDVAEATYRKGDKIIKQLSGSTPKSTVQTRDLFDTRKQGDWIKQDKDLFRTDFASKQQRGVQFFDDKTFRTFETTGTQTAKTRVKGFDVDVIETKTGRLSETRRLNLELPSGKGQGVSGIDDTFPMKVNEDVFGFETNVRGVTDKFTKLDDTVEFGLSGQQRIKSKPRQWVEDLFGKKPKTRTKGLVEEEEVLTKFADNFGSKQSDDLLSVQKTRAKSRVSLDFDQPKFNLDIFTKKSLNVKPLKFSAKVNINAGSIFGNIGLGKTSVQPFIQARQESKTSGFFKTFEQPKTRFDSFTQFKPITQQKVDSFVKTDFASDFDIQTKPITKFEEYKPPKIDPFKGFDSFKPIKTPTLPLLPGFKGFQSGSKRKYDNFSKGGFKIQQRKLKKLYKEIGL